MLFTIELTPLEQKRVLRAKENGVDVDSMIHRLISQLPALEALEEQNRDIDVVTQESDVLRRDLNGLETFLSQFVEKGSKQRYLTQEAFDRENLYEDRT